MPSRHVEKDRKAEIDRQNHELLEKMSKITQRKQQLSNQGKGHLKKTNVYQRYRNWEKIAADNVFLARRLEGMKPTMNFRGLEEDFTKHLYYQSKLTNCHHRPLHCEPHLAGRQSDEESDPDKLPRIKRDPRYDRKTSPHSDGSGGGTPKLPRIKDEPKLGVLRLEHDYQMYYGDLYPDVRRSRQDWTGKSARERAADEEARRIRRAVKGKDDPEEALKRFARMPYGERQRVEDAYREMYKSELEPDLAKKIEKEEQHVLDALAAKRPDANSNAIENAIYDNELKKLVDLFVGKSPEELKDANKQYKKDCDGSIDEALDDLIMDPPAKIVLRNLLKNKNKDKGRVDEEAAEADARELAKWIERGDPNLSDADGKLLALTRKKNPDQVKRALRKYKELTGHDIADDMKKQKCSADYCDVIRALSKARGRPDEEPEAAAAALHEELRKRNPDLSRLLADNEEQMPAVRAAYRDRFAGSDLPDDVRRRTGDREGPLMEIMASKGKDKKKEPKKEETPQEEEPPKEEPKRKIKKRKARPTIFAAKNFRAETDAERLAEAFKGFGSNEDDIVEVLCKRDNAQRQEIASAYADNHGKELNGTIGKELRGDFEKVITATMVPKDEYDASCVRDAIRRVGVDQDAVISLLATKSDKELNATKKAYQKKYEKSLSEDIADETSGELRKVLDDLARTKRVDNADEVDRKQADRDAQGLWNNGDSALGRRGDALRSFLVGNNTAQIRETFGRYRKCAGRSLEADIKRSFDTEDGRTYLSLCGSVTKDADDGFVDLLHATLSAKETNDDLLIQTCVARSEIDLQDVKEKYKKKFGRSLETEVKGKTSGHYQRALVEIIKGNYNHDARGDEKPKKKPKKEEPKKEEPKKEEPKKEEPKKEKAQRDVKPTVFPAKEFNPERDADVLFEAMKGFGTKEQPIIDTICTRDNAQRQEIAAAFRNKHNKDLNKELESELTGDFEKTILDLMVPTAEYEADLMEKAIKKQDRNLILHTLSTKEEKELDELKKCYAAKFRRDMLKDIESKAKKNSRFSEAVSELQKQDRDCGDDVDQNKASKVAASLWKNGKKPIDGQEELLMNLLLKENYQQISSTLAEYEKLAKHPVDQDVKKSCSSDNAKTFVALRAASQHPVEYCAGRLEQSAAGFGTNDDLLRSICVSRSEIDMQTVKDAYKVKYNKSLKETVTSETSGDYRNALLEIIDEDYDRPKAAEPEQEEDVAQKFRPTIHPAEKFNANRDAQTLQNALKKKGKDDRELIDIIALRSNEQRQEIRRAFEKNNKKSLQDEMSAKKSGQWEELCMNGLLMKNGDYDAYCMQQAMEGRGADEDLIVGILATSDSDKINEMKTRFKSNYGEDLTAELKKETRGDLEDIVVELEKGKRKKGQKVVQKKAVEDAKNLYNEGKNSLDPKMTRFFAVMTEENPNQVKATCEAYEKEAKHPIEVDIKNRFSGDTEAAYLALAASSSDQLEFFADRIHDAIKQKNDRKLIRCCISRSEIDLEDVKDTYKQKYKTDMESDVKAHCDGDYQRALVRVIRGNLADDKDLMDDLKNKRESKTPRDDDVIEEDPMRFRGTIKAAKKFDAEKDAAVMHEAMAGKGVREKPIIDLLCLRNNLQRQEIKKEYQRKYKKDLEEELTCELRGDYEDQCIFGLLMTPDNYDAHCLDKAMEGKGADEDMIIATMATSDAEGVSAMKKAYQKTYNNDLTTEIKKNTKSTLEDVLVSLEKGDREKGFKYRKRQTEEDAKQLWNNGKNPLESRKLREVMTKNNPAHLRAVTANYKKIAGHPIQDDIRKEYSGDTENAYLTLVNASSAQLDFYSESIHNAIEDDDNPKLIRCCISRSEVDLEDVKEVYKKKYKKDLETDIKQNTVGDYQRALVRIVRGNLADDSDLMDDLRREKKEEEKPQMEEDTRKYRGTVEEIRGFDAAEDAKEIMKAIDDDNKNKMVDILCKRTFKQREQVAQKFEQKYKKNLANEIAAESSKNHEDQLLRDVLMGEDQRNAKYANTVFANSDMEALMCLLATENCKGLKASLKKHHGKDLEKEVKSGVPSDLRDMALSMSSGTENSRRFDRKRAEKDGQLIFNNGDLKNGSLRDVLASSSSGHVLAASAEYQRVSGKALEYDVKRAYRGDSEKVLLTTVAARREAPEALAEQLHDALEKRGLDDPKLRHVVVSRSEIDLENVKKCYKSKYKTELEPDVRGKTSGAYQRGLVRLIRGNLADDSDLNEAPARAPMTREQTQYIKPNYRGTLRDSNNFSAEKDAETLKKAMVGVGVDEKPIIDILCTRSNRQRQEIKEAYKKKYRKDLDKELECELRGDYEDQLMFGLLKNPGEYDAFCMEKAMDGKGADEDMMIGTLSAADGKGVEAMKAAYGKMYRKDMVGEIKRETLGDFEDLMLQMAKGERDAGDDVNLATARDEASALYNNGKSPLKSKSANFLHVITKRNRMQVKATCDEYKKIAGHDIVDDIRKAYSDDAERAYVMLTETSSDQLGFFAQRVHDALQDSDDPKLIRIVISRSEIDLHNIKERYEKEFGHSLASDVMKESAGDYQRALLLIISGNY